MKWFRTDTGNWINLDFIREIWIKETIRGQYNIHCMDDKDDRFDLMKKCFFSREEAQLFLDGLINNNVYSTASPTIQP